MVKILSPLLVIFTLSCTALPALVEPGPSKLSGIGQKIFVVNHGWHTGVIIESSALKEIIPELAQRFSGSEYLEVGWGDAGFYQAKDITFWLVMRALLWPTDAVVHVVGFSEHPQTYFSASSVNSVVVNQENLRTLVRFIHGSFAYSESGTPESIQQGIYGNSWFYEGVGRYYLFNTCNTWTAKALYSAGININPTFRLTASGITRFLSELEP